jgi:phage FluMu protein Com
MVTFRCEHCGRQMTAGSALLHRRIRCPACLRLTLVADEHPGRPPFPSVSEVQSRVYHTNGPNQGKSRR